MKLEQNKEAQWEKSYINISQFNACFEKTRNTFKTPLEGSKIQICDPLKDLKFTDNILRPLNVSEHCFRNMPNLSQKLKFLRYRESF